jgi:tetratricopeptide (TPR) repeat protein
MSGLSRLRRARVSKARNQRRLGVLSELEERSDPLMRSWSVTKSLILKAVGVWTVLASIALSAVGTLLFLGLCYLLYQAVTSSAIEVAPISVPKTLAEEGYTSEAVTRQLRGALLDFMKGTRTKKRTADVLSQRDEPTIALPQTGLSLDTVAEEIRSRFGFGNVWKISGSIETEGEQLDLQISVDGARIYKHIIVSQNYKYVDKLFILAAEEISKVIDPYVVAASYHDKDPNKSIELARQIIWSRPAGDQNVAWAHILISSLEQEAHNWPGAEKEARSAIAINRNIATGHINLGASLFNQGRLNEAFEEFREAIWINSRDEIAYYDLGVLFEQEGMADLALTQYKKAIEIDNNYSEAHNNIGAILRDRRDLQGAVEEDRKAVLTNPKSSTAFVNLGSAMFDQGKIDEAIEEYRKAISIDPRSAFAHYNLGNALESKGALNAAIEEYDEAVGIEPDNATYLNAQKDALTRRDQRPPPAAQASIDYSLMPPQPP